MHGLDYVFGSFGSELVLVEQGHPEGADDGVLIFDCLEYGVVVLNIAFEGVEVGLGLGELVWIACERGDCVAEFEGLFDDELADTPG